MLKVGTKVQDFTLPDAYGKQHRLSDYLGKKIVIYFYPKDNTSGCTTQACAFRDQYDAFKEKDIIVIEDYDLPFILLSDEDIKVCKYFGVYVEKSMYGKKYMGVNRQTFILNEEGVITHVFEKASPKENAAEILRVLS
jgi:thioredoxin-dependent peroxiredoxin